MYEKRFLPFKLIIIQLVILLHASGEYGNSEKINADLEAAAPKRVEQRQRIRMAGEFVIGAFPGPPQGYINEARFQEIAAAGIDVIVPFWGTMDGEHNRDMLDLAQSAGLRVLAMDTRIGSLTRSPKDPFDGAVIEGIVGDYKSHPSLFAYGVRDEPSAELLPRLAEICGVFRRLDPDHPPLVNLFPGYATSSQLGTESYRDYVLKYIEAVDPAVLMYDHYPYKANRALDTGWHRDLALFREISRKRNIPFWIFVQCQGIRDSLRVPTQTEIFRQAATALAYGVRGIWWYRYWTQPPSDESTVAKGDTASPERHLGSMIDRNGERSPSYEYVRETNRFLRQAGPALLGWDNAHVARISNGRTLSEGSCPGITLAGEDYDVVVGTFTRGKTMRLVLANDDCERPAIFRVKPAAGLKVREVIASWKVKVPPDPNTAKDTWRLGPAGCMVMELAPR